jgi:hypothetical protein
VATSLATLAAARAIEDSLDQPRDAVGVGITTALSLRMSQRRVLDPVELETVIGGEMVSAQDAACIPAIYAWQQARPLGSDGAEPAREKMLSACEGSRLGSVAATLEMGRLLNAKGPVPVLP